MTSSPALRPRLTPERIRSGPLAVEQMARAHDHAIGRRAAHREPALGDLAQPQRIVERQRVRHARLVVFRRDHPDIVGNGAGDLLAHVEPFRMDAVVIGDQDAHRYSNSPPPCGEGLGVGVGRLCGGKDVRSHIRLCGCLASRPPTPSLPHKGGGCSARLAHKSAHCFSIFLMPPIYGASASGTAIDPSSC